MVQTSFRPSPIARRNHRVAFAFAFATAVAVLALGAGEATAGSGGAGGGVGAPAPPQPRSVNCAKRCAGPRKAIAGSVVVVGGSHLGSVAHVRFATASSKRAAVAPSKVRSHAVAAKVPKGAKTGKLAVADGYGNAAVAPKQLKIVKRLPPNGGFKVTGASASPRKVYYDGVRRARLHYVFSGANPLDVRVDVVSVATGATVASIVDRSAEPNTQNVATWNGVNSAGRAPRGGRYRFSIVPSAGGTPTSVDQATFAYHAFEFPVRGPHTYGDGVGAPRSGHVHEGQDILASCGTPIVAARGGRIQWNAYQASGAGNYVVIDGKGTGHDYVYMHLAQRSPLKKGQVVRTGQRIGVVGETGDATGCHLHFEEWSAPGWYQGGHYMRAVTKHLKRWDHWS